MKKHIILIFLFLGCIPLRSSDSYKMSSQQIAQDQKNKQILDDVAQVLNKKHKLIFVVGYSPDIGMELINLMSENKIAPRTLFNFKSISLKNKDKTQFHTFYSIIHDGIKFISNPPDSFQFQNHFSIKTIVERYINQQNENTLLVFSLDSPDIVPPILLPWIRSLQYLGEWTIVVNVGKNFAESDIIECGIRDGYFFIEAQEKNHMVRTIIFGSAVLIGLLILMRNYIRR